MQEGEALAKQPDYALNKLERTYLDVCVSKRTHSATRRRNRNLLLSTLLVIVVLMIIGGLIEWVVYQQQLITRLPVSVTNTNDSGPGSLREAIQNAKNGDAITFAKTLTAPDGQNCTQCTITLTGGELEITKSITISGPSGSGPGERLLTISGQHKSRIFYVHTGVTVTISNLAIKDGFRPCATGGGCDTSGGRGLGFGGDGDQRVGGAIFNGRGTTLNLTNIVVSESTAGYGIIFNNGTLTLANCTVSNNKESGIFNINTLSIIKSTISDNNASYGTGINNYLGHLTLISSTIFGNTASGNGGGIYSLGSADLSNSNISGNRANIGGGISYPARSSMEIDYSTIYQNEAKTGGGGIAAISSFMEASIVAGNVAPHDPDIWGSITLAFPNLIQNVSSGTEISYNCEDPRPVCGHHQSIFGKSPMLGPLQNNGGPTKTHALLPGSPAIDQLPPDRSNSRTYYSSICDNLDNTFDSSYDQRGVKRPQGPACDIGAYEAQD